ncbi:hypothetical protein FI667_g3940, partial [Globisporangium splendens]
MQLVSALLKQVAPFSDWLFIEKKEDETEWFFYQLVKDGIAGFPFPELLSEVDFFQYVSSLSISSVWLRLTMLFFRLLSSRISTFFVEIEQHELLVYDNYTATESDTGDKLGEFLRKWLTPSNNTTEPGTAAPSSLAAALLGAAPLLLAVTCSWVLLMGHA